MALNEQAKNDLNTQIKSAIGAHGMWKVRLDQAIEKGSSEYTVAGVQVDNQCAFGKTR